MQKKCKKSLAYLIYICGCVRETNAHHKALFFIFFFACVHSKVEIGQRMKLMEGGKERERKEMKNRASESALFCSSTELERSSCLHLVTEIFNAVYMKKKKNHNNDYIILFSA